MSDTITTNTVIIEDHTEYIDTFKQLMDLICYDWGFANSELTRWVDDDGEVKFFINKTYITATEVSYKTSNYVVRNPIVFQKLEKFYELLQYTDSEKILYGTEEGRSD